MIIGYVDRSDIAVVYATKHSYLTSVVSLGMECVDKESLNPIKIEIVDESEDGSGISVKRIRLPDDFRGKLITFIAKVKEQRGTSTTFGPPEDTIRVDFVAK
jgi:hypothetical protein